MIRKILKSLGLAVALLLIVAAVLYMFGLRPVLDGGGTPHLTFVESESARLKRIAQHREAQRAQAESAALIEIVASGNDLSVREVWRPLAQTSRMLAVVVVNQRGAVLTARCRHIGWRNGIRGAALTE